MKHKLLALLIGLLILCMLSLACQDDWDGMDRSSWTPVAPGEGYVIVTYTPRGE